MDIDFLSELDAFCEQFGFIVGKTGFHASTVEIKLKYILSFFPTMLDFKARDFFQSINAVFHVLEGTTGI
jgi:hypothetical protein